MAARAAARISRLREGIIRPGLPASARGRVVGRALSTTLDATSAVSHISRSEGRIETPWPLPSRYARRAPERYARRIVLMLRFVSVAASAGVSGSTVGKSLIGRKVRGAKSLHWLLRRCPD